MSEKTKVVNYTQAMVDRLYKVYQPDASEAERDAQVKALSEELGRSPKSIRQKLVTEGLYVKKVYKSKTGVKPATKETIVTDIARQLGVDADTTLSGLENATKNCLVFLQRFVSLAVPALTEKSE
jgi:hypothetical protein